MNVMYVLILWLLCWQIICESNMLSAIFSGLQTIKTNLKALTVVFHEGDIIDHVKGALNDAIHQPNGSLSTVEFGKF